MNRDLRPRPRPIPLRLLAGLLALTACGAGARAWAQPVDTGHVVAELVPETTSARAGGGFVVALRQKIAPGWHTYWRNPGDAGQPTSITWTLPPGWSAGDIAWPAPERFLSGPIMNYVYTGEVDLPVTLRPPPGASGRAAIKASANWLVCKDVCIPEHAELALDTPVGPDAPRINPHGGAGVAAALASVPRPAGLTARFEPRGGKVVLDVAGAPLRGLAAGGAYFYPFDGTALDQAAPQTASRTSGEGVRLLLPAGYGFSHGQPPARLEGVLSIGAKAFEIAASRGEGPSGALAVSPAAAAGDHGAPGGPAPGGATPRGAAPGEAAPGGAAVAGAPAPKPASAPAQGLFGALAFALLGGLILNLMPCVFPVLSMKAAALARHVEAPGAARREGLAFMAGVVVSLMALAVLLILARGAGQAVGWGFQLQSPAVVAALALVMLATGLNLSGVFEIGASLQGVGAEAASRRGGMAGAAFTGALAVVVAAPCTAPFMAPAIGWALVQPPTASLLVFLALALGLAAPFTLLSFAPGLFRRLPRPGAWMEGLRKTLAFPMYGAAAWLAWVFSLQTGPQGLPGLFAAALALAFATFCWGVAQRSGRRVLPAAAAIAALAGGTAALLGALAAPVAGSALAEAPAGADTAGGDTGTVGRWTPREPQRLQALGRPVFVDFTAAWCVTCQVNERTALADAGVRAAFARTGARYLKADWTRPDPEIARALAAQGRSGVPLYLVYPRASGAPKVLPQILTPALVTQALDDAAKG